MDVIVAWIDRIGETGALERYFRPEGKYGDGVSAIPIESGKLRLYCLRLSDKILILETVMLRTQNLGKKVRLFLLMFSC